MLADGKDATAQGGPSMPQRLGIASSQVHDTPGAHAFKTGPACGCIALGQSSVAPDAAHGRRIDAPYPADALRVASHVTPPPEPRPKPLT